MQVTKYKKNFRNPCKCGSEKGTNQKNCTLCKQYAEAQTVGE